MNTAEYWKYEKHKGKWRKKPAIAKLEQEIAEAPPGFSRVYTKHWDTPQSVALRQAIGWLEWLNGLIAKWSENDFVGKVANDSPDAYWDRQHRRALSIAAHNARIDYYREA